MINEQSAMVADCLFCCKIEKIFFSIFLKKVLTNLNMCGIILLVVITGHVNMRD